MPFQRQRQQQHERTKRDVPAPKKKHILVQGSSLEGLTTVLAMNHAMEKHGVTGKNLVDVRIGTLDHDTSDRTFICNPNVMRVFDRLHVMDKVLQRGHVLGHYTVCSSRGQNLLELDWEKMSNKEFDGMPFVSIEESALLSVLSNAVKETGIATVTQSSDAQVNYDEKNEKITTSMRTIRMKRNYDLLIGADGVDSPIRNIFYAGVGAENIGTGKPGVIIRPDANVTLPQEFTPQSNRYQSAGIMLDCPEDLDYQDQCFEWNVMQSRMGVIPLHGNRIFIFAQFYQGGDVTSTISSKGMQVATMIARSFKSIRGLGGDMIISILERMGKSQRHHQDIVGYTTNLKSLVLNDTVHSNGKIVLVGSAGHMVDNSLWQQTTVDAEEGYVLGTHLGEALATASMEDEEPNIASALSQFNQTTLPRAKDLDQIGRMYAKASYRGFWHHDIVKTIKMISGKKYLVKRRMNQSVAPNALL